MPTAVRPEVGEKLVLELTAWGRLGEAMGCHDGRDVFVFGGIPGERVVAEVVDIRRRRLAARVVEVLEPSPHRVEPPCPYFGDCTGCQWQHISYRRQLEAKREKVVDALQRVGGFCDPPVAAVIPSNRQLNYRNHARFTVRDGGVLGQAARKHSGDAIPVDEACRAIVRAMEKRQRELFMPPKLKALLWLSLLSPRIADALIERAVGRQR